MNKLTNLNALGGVFENAELLRLTLDTLDADYRVCESFRHKAADPLPVPLHLFAGRQDDIEAERVEAWRREAGTTFSLDWFDGGHFFIRSHEQAVLAAIVRDLVHQFSGVKHAAAAIA